jgi:hypothetical protein
MGLRENGLRGAAAVTAVQAAAGIATAVGVAVVAHADDSPAQPSSSTSTGRVDPGVSSGSTSDRSTGGWSGGGLSSSDGFGHARSGGS